MRGTKAKALRKRVYGDFASGVRRYEYARDRKGAPTYCIVSTGLRSLYQATKQARKKGGKNVR